MSITRYGAGSTAGGGQPRPFARAVEADGWLHVSGPDSYTQVASCCLLYTSDAADE